MREFIALALFFIAMIYGSMSKADPACLDNYRAQGYNIGHDAVWSTKATAYVVVAVIPLPVAGGTYVDFGHYDRTFVHTRPLHRLKGNLSALANSYLLFGAVDHPTLPSYLVGVEPGGRCIAIEMARKRT